MSTTPSSPLTTPTAVKIEEARTQITQGNVTPASPLTLDTAEKVNFWSQLLATPAGKTAVAGATAAFVALMTVATNWITTKTGAPIDQNHPEIKAAVQAALKDMVISVKIVDPLKFQIDPIDQSKPIPTPLPSTVPTIPPNKSFGLVTFSTTVPPFNDQAFWTAIKSKGYKISHYTFTSPEANDWADLIKDIPNPNHYSLLMITDPVSSQYLGGATIIDKNAVIDVMKTYVK